MSNCQIIPTRLRCEYRTDPVGLGETAPRLSWVPEATSQALRGCCQSAWQVQVTDADGGFDSPTHWDSGRQDGDDCMQVVYQGKPLKANDHVLWRVRVWDGKGEPSEWSRVAHWRMGLLGSADWKAKWIEAPAPLLFNRCCWVWHPEVGNAHHGAPKGSIVLRTKVSIDKDMQIAAAKLLVATEQSIQVFVNGSEVPRNTILIDKDPRITIVDLSGMKWEGETILSIVVRHEQDGKPAGVAGKLILQLQDGGQRVLPINQEWKVDHGEDVEWNENAPHARILARVGLTDPVCNPLTPWGVPGRDDGLVLPAVPC